MTTGTLTFGTRLRRALTGRDDARFVHLGNFEVERTWARGEPALPGAGLAFTAATVNRMEEMALGLAEPGDVVVLKAPPDPAFAAFLERAGVSEGRVVVVGRNDPVRGVTEDVLDSPSTLDTLRGLADGRTFLLPMGVSAAEEVLSALTGIPLAGPSAAVCKAVNGKIYSRRLTDALGLRAVPGTVCETVDELAAALEEHLPHGRVAVKESLGVSGRGMVVLSEQRRADTLLKMLRRRGGDARVDVVVERWIDGGTDLNYQFLISRDGDVRFEAVRAAVVVKGVHKGHRFPVELPARATGDLHRATELIGRALHADGYHGVVGVDAILDADGDLYPCLEINARLNMSTYANRTAERLIGPGKHAVAATIALRPVSAHTFTEVADALGDAVFDGSTGVLVTGFATLNAAAPATPGEDFPGRVYALCVADSPDGAAALRDTAQDRLTALTDGGSPC